MLMEHKKVMSDELSTYLDDHSSNHSELLEELRRETFLKTTIPIMISHPTQGVLLSMISSMINPKSILEIGTFTGYGTIALSSGLKEGGRITTIDNNPESLVIAERFFKKAGLSEQITVIQSDALLALDQLDWDFDLVFLDADKLNYPYYIDKIVEKAKPGTFIIADNVLWNGRVLSKDKDNKTSALDTFNKQISKDSRVRNILIPFRDGLMLIERM